MEHPVTWLGYVCVACALVAIVILVRQLWMRPKLNFVSKMWLFLGLGILPSMSATTSTVTGMEATKQRHFCSSCHTMDYYIADAGDLASQSLAARHSRNPFFGDHSCYTCHADYGMLGYPMTKLTGMRHVYEFYLNGWKNLSQEEALSKIHLTKPYDNTNCRQCHTGTLTVWSAVPEHVALENELSNNTVSCASGGCHGYAHPKTKVDGAAAMGSPPGGRSRHSDPRITTSSLPSAAAAKVQAVYSVRSAEAKAKVDAKLADDEAKRAAAKKAARERTQPKAPKP